VGYRLDSNCNDEKDLASQHSFGGNDDIPCQEKVRQSKQIRRIECHCSLVSTAHKSPHGTMRHYLCWSSCRRYSHLKAGQVCSHRGEERIDCHEHFEGKVSAHFAPHFGKCY